MTSAYILEELRRTLETKPYFVERVSAVERETYLARIKEVAILVSPAGAVSGVATDPSDDPILDAAVSGQVDYLVTGDKRVLAVNEYAGVKIVTARAFYDLMIAGGADEGTPS